MLNKKEHILLELMRMIQNPALADEMAEFILDRGVEYQRMLDEAYEAAIADDDDDEGIQTL